MTDNNDTLIASFFERNAIRHLPDNGFTRNVMSSLPSRQADRTIIIYRLWSVACLLAGVVLFVSVDGISTLKDDLAATLSGMKSYITSFPVSLTTLLRVFVVLVTLTCLTVFNLCENDEYGEVWT